MSYKKILFDFYRFLWIRVQSIDKFDVAFNRFDLARSLGLYNIGLSLSDSLVLGIYRVWKNLLKSHDNYSIMYLVLCQTRFVEVLSRAIEISPLENTFHRYKAQKFRALFDIRR